MHLSFYKQWTDLPEQASRLFEQAEQESLFLSRTWLENFTSTVLTNDLRLLLACVMDGDEVMALLPLMESSAGVWVSLSNQLSSFFGLLLADRSQEVVLACLAEGLKGARFQQLKLDPLDLDDPGVRAFRAAMEKVGFRTHDFFHFYNWIYRVEGRSFEVYMQGRPGQVRNTIERKARKLNRELGYEIRLYVDEDLDKAFEDYNKVYEGSWKGHEAFEDFVNGLFGCFPQRGWLRFAVLYIAGEPVAAQIWFVAHGKASIFRLTYDEAWKRYSPGSILTRYLMKHVIDVDQVHEIDFLNGNDQYKQDWMSERRERWGLYFEKPQETNSWFARWRKALRQGK